MAVRGINLLPQEYKVEEGKGELLRSAKFLCAVELALLAVILLGIFGYRSRVGNRWLFYQQQIEAQKEFINNETNRVLEGKLRIIKGKAQYLSDFFTQRYVFGNFLEDFLTRLPPGVRLAALKQGDSGTEYEVRGQAGSMEQVDRFVEEIEQLEKVSLVSLQTCDYLIREGRVNFSLKVKESNLR
jgi:Tfp pilus assembly protein PilN